MNKEAQLVCIHSSFIILLLRHDGEVERIVVKDDAVLELCIRGRASYSQAYIPKRRSHQGVPGLLQRRLLRHEELVGVLRSAVGMFKEGHHRGTRSSTG